MVLVHRACVTKLPWIQALAFGMRLAIRRRVDVVKKVLTLSCCTLFVGAGLAQSNTGGWRRVGDDPASNPAAASRTGAPAPASLTLPAGTFVRVRVNEMLSTNVNRAGDAFTVTLSEPLIAQGFVVARRGQTFGGHVGVSEKGGRIRGTSRLGLELTGLTLVDGQQIPLRSELIQFTGGTTLTRDGTAIASGSALGAIIGGAAEGGAAAGIGAAAGAAAATIGVLATRGRATVVYPEDVLTFRTLAPIPISTEGSANVFAPVQQSDYESALQTRQSRRISQSARPYYGAGPYWGYGGLWGPWGYPYPYFGTRVIVGGRFGGFRGGYFGGRFGGRGRR